MATRVTQVWILHRLKSWSGNGRQSRCSQNYISEKHTAFQPELGLETLCELGLKRCVFLRDIVLVKTRLPLFSDRCTATCTVSYM